MAPDERARMLADLTQGLHAYVSHKVSLLPQAQPPATPAASPEEWDGAPWWKPTQADLAASDKQSGLNTAQWASNHGQRSFAPIQTLKKVLGLLRRHK